MTDKREDGDADFTGREIGSDAIDTTATNEEAASENVFRYAVTGLIDEALTRAGIEHQRVATAVGEQTWVRVRVKHGLHVVVRFIVDGEADGVKVRVYDLVTGVPDEKYVTVLKACNTLNNAASCLRFSLDQSNCVQVSYDILPSAVTGDVGLMAVDVLGRVAETLEESYEMLTDSLEW